MDRETGPDGPGVDAGPPGVYRNPAVAIRQLGAKGRGLVALARIPAGAVIDRSPVLVIPEADRGHVDRTIVFAYVFSWEPDRAHGDLYDGRGRAAMALGIASLLNHSPRPNAEIVRHIEAAELEARAIRDIEPGEEITIDYQMKLWFDPL